MNELIELRKLAEAATQGEWENNGTRVYLPHNLGGFDIRNAPNVSSPLDERAVWGYSAEQMKQYGLDLLEEAEKEMLKKSGELGIFNHHATKQFVQVVRSLKEAL